MSKNAIISVYDKKDLDIISKHLIKKNYTIYSTGGTSDFLKKIIFLILKFLNIPNKKRYLVEE